MPIAEAAFRMKKVSKSETIDSSCFLAFSRFEFGSFGFGDTRLTKPVFSKLEMMFLMVLQLGDSLVARDEMLTEQTLYFEIGSKFLPKKQVVKYRT